MKPFTSEQLQVLFDRSLWGILYIASISLVVCLSLAVIAWIREREDSGYWQYLIRSGVWSLLLALDAELMWMVGIFKGNLFFGREKMGFVREFIICFLRQLRPATLNIVWYGIICIPMYAYCIKTKKGMDLASPFVLSAFMLLCVIVQPVSVTLLATAKSAHFMASKITAILCIVLMWIVTGVIAYIGFKRIELHPNKKGGTNLE